MRRSNVALRLQEALLSEAKKVAETEGVALNQFINVAVAETLSALRGNVATAKRILRRAGKGNPLVPGDELPVM